MAFDGAVRYEGSVKSFNPEKGWGHIECPQIFEQYGKDVFLLKSQLLSGSVSKGQIVRFSLTDNGRGPEAMQIEVVGAAIAPPVAQQSMAMQPPPAQQTGMYVGQVKSFNPNSGWGHISCPQTEQIFGKDMFFMKSSVPGGHIQKGTTVQFSVSQGLKGPEASQIRPVNGGGMMAAPMSEMMPVPMSEMMPMAMGAPMMAAPPMPQMRSQPPMRTTVGNVGGPMNAGAGSGSMYYGTVKAFNEEKGWGHISCPQTQAIYGKDMFLLRSALNGSPCNVGDNVQFQVSMGQKGPEAANVKVLGAGVEQQIFAGTVKQWNEEKGYGFIACEETRALYQKDIFIHKKDLNDHNPMQGEPVQFSVQISTQGRPEANMIVFTNDAAAAGYGAWKAAAPAARPGPF